MTLVNFYATCTTLPVPFCCGAYEAGQFECGAWEGDGETSGQGETKSAAYASMLSEILNATGYSYQFWFAKYKNYDDIDNEHYEAQELLDLVKAYPGSINISPEHRNPNSDNLIQGWIINTF